MNHCLTYNSANNPTDTILPISYGIGSKPILNNLTLYTSHIPTLSPANPILTLDYGSEVLGIPTLDIGSLSGRVQIELKYTEEYAGLDNIYGDGPWTFSNGLSNTFRTETFEVKEPGTLKSFFLQGGLRWQTIRLLTNGSVTFSSIGLRTSTPIIANDHLPGSFNSSNEIYNEIWGLGAKAVQAACVDKGTLRSTWEVTHDGALIRGQQTAQSFKGVAYSNYTMSFMTKIVRGGTGWKVASSVNGHGPYFVLTSSYPSDSTFVNTNTTLLPPNSLVAGYGWSLVNQTTLPTGPVDSYPVSLPINENEWLNIRTSITEEGFKISLNGTQITTISYAEGLAWASSTFGSGGLTGGTWGFGPFQDQIAYVKDVKVIASNGTLLSSNDMLSQDTLIEYGVNVNDASVCLDGPKRDRLVWIGDFVHTARMIASSTDRIDYITEVMDFEFARQLTSGTLSGYVPTQYQLGASNQNKVAYNQAAYGIRDYQFFFMVTIGDYYKMTGDLPTIQRYWKQIQTLTAAIMTLIDPYSGLVAATSSSDFFFSGPPFGNGTTSSALLVLALRQLLPVAQAIGDNSTAASYKTSADALSAAINKQLWNDELGTYSYSLTSPGNFSAAGIAFAIRAGIANETQAALSISKLPELKYGVGYITETPVVKANDTQLSPNFLGFLLESLFIANSTLGVQTLDVAKDLLDNFWSKMVTQNQYYTGASWEYLYPDGSPGLGLYTSLSHPWGGAPTYILPQYVLGVSSLEPGYKTWQFKPLIYGLGLEDASGKVPTPHGIIEASWKFIDGRKLVLSVEGPAGTIGTVSLPFVASNCSVSGNASQSSGSSLIVHGGSKVEIIAFV